MLSYTHSESVQSSVSQIAAYIRSKESVLSNNSPLSKMLQGNIETELKFLVASVAMPALCALPAEDILKYFDLKILPEELTPERGLVLPAMRELLNLLSGDETPEAEKTAVALLVLFQSLPVRVDEQKEN
jgi:hypothetical protein